MKTIFIVAVAFVVDVSIREIFLLGMWSPDILLLAVLFIFLHRPLGEAYTIAFFAGLMWDAAYLDIFGSHAFLYVGAVMLLTRIKRILSERYTITRLLLGISVCAIVRFGEVIVWLSLQQMEIASAIPQTYIMTGPLVSGILFVLLPWKIPTIRLPRRSPQTVFTNRF